METGVQGGWKQGKELGSHCINPSKHSSSSDESSSGGGSEKWSDSESILKGEDLVTNLKWGVKAREESGMLSQVSGLSS